MRPNPARHTPPAESISPLPDDLCLLPESLQDDIRTYRALKPYLAHCLNMNHELNNALAGVMGYCDLLLEDPETTESIAEQLQYIQRSAERMKDEIDRLCLEKIELAEKVDLRAIRDLYEPHAKSFAD